MRCPIEVDLDYLVALQMLEIGIDTLNIDTKLRAGGNTYAADRLKRLMDAVAVLQPGRTPRTLTPADVAMIGAQPAAVIAETLADKFGEVGL